MNPAFQDAARVGVAILVNSLWQGALIALATWFAMRFFSSANAATRYAVWMFALVAIAVVPVLTSLSRVSVICPTTLVGHATTSAPGAHSATTGRAASRSGHTATTQPADLKGAGDDTVLPQAGGSSLTFRLPDIANIAAAIVFGLWGLAAAAVVVRLFVSLMALERLKRDSLPLRVEFRDAMTRWNVAVRGDRDVRICTSDETEVPVAVGLFDSMILLPAHLVDSLSPDEIDQITLHELGHLRRGDDWTNALQRVISALLFFNPAVWFVSRNLDVEREVACDDYVLQMTGAARPYAFCLTRMAEITAWPHRAVAAPGVFVTRKNISIRIERLLRSGRAIGSSIAPGAAGAVLVSLLAIFLVLRTMTPSIAFTLAAPVAPASPVAAASPAAHVKPVIVQEKTVVIATATAPAAPRPVATALPVAALTAAPVTISHAVSRALHAHSNDVAYNSDGADCTGCNFSHANLSGQDFSHRPLEGANFSGANLRGTNFEHADMEGANFSGADLSNASFVDANLEGCNLEESKLEGARFAGAELTGCNIDARNLNQEQLREFLSACDGCSFADAHMQGMDLHGIHLEGTNLAAADLSNVNLTGASFDGVNFAGADLSGANVKGASFTGCNFSGARLRGVDFSHTNIEGSNMSHAIW
jgi:uncharacterized protein YjbI with pentapeptide repeats/beta-lactamase regulating signal transducer with metallopeptidase domain